MLRRKSESGRDHVEARIRIALGELAPLLRVEPTDLQLVSFEEQTGAVTLRLEGECPDCAMSLAVFRQGIEAHLGARVGEVRAVRIVDATISETHG